MTELENSLAKRTTEEETRSGFWFNFLSVLQKNCDSVPSNPDLILTNQLLVDCLRGETTLV